MGSVGTRDRAGTQTEYPGGTAEARPRPVAGPLAALADRVLTGVRSADAVWAVVIGGILGWAYVVTLLPGVFTFGDTTKFQYLGRVLGTPHPTGYPTYLMLNHVFVRLWPFGSLAQNANLLSAVFTVVAVVVLFKLLTALGVAPLLASAAGLTFGFTRTVWSQSIMAEVYTLNLLFVAATVYLLTVWHLRRRDGYLIAGLGVYAFSFGNHLTMVTFLPAIAWLVFTTDASSVLRLRNVATTAVFVVLSALQYSYVFWRSSVEHPGFLEMRATTLDEFWWWIRGGPFASQMFAFPAEEVISERIPRFLDFFRGEYGVLTAVILLGLVTLRSLRLNVFFLLCAAGNVFYAVNYDVGDYFVYFIPTYFVAAIYLGLGFDRITRLLARLGTALVAAGRRRGAPPRPAGPGQASFSRAQALFVLVPWVMALANLAAVDQSENRAAAMATEAILQEVGSNAVVITASYHYSDYQSLMYYLAGEGRAEDNVHALWAARPQAVAAYLCEGRPLELPLQKLTVPPGSAVYALRPPDRLDRVGLCTDDGADCAYATTSGWYDPDTTDPLWWRWSDGIGRVWVYADRAMEVTIDGVLGTKQRTDRVDVLLNGGVQRTLDVASGDGRPLGAIPLRLEAGENLLEFRAQTPAVSVPSDPRRLAFAVQQLSMTSAGNGPACDFLL
ncbi:MAG: hypothetical protein AVDCRST_MAG49-1910 [uncultured Thermomicrobiales bacterium]|uniref:DUF2723 domain-containing protein n=1 Tax=uncultured Thermomicrobiales bacterium TaxID=1645740 RepID=A0A6J4UNG4_9BACT|nr:MAG: hypothetical protein AVDCRST_MAG49-1910 [uncultured Thermomicrobiales bacterium]